MRILSAKLRQLLEERTQLQAQCAQREGDVTVLSQEVVRLRRSLR